MLNLSASQMGVFFLMLFTIPYQPGSKNGKVDSKYLNPSMFQTTEALLTNVFLPLWPGRTFYQTVNSNSHQEYGVLS